MQQRTVIETEQDRENSRKGSMAIPIIEIEQTMIKWV